MKIGIFDPYLDTLTGGERYMLTIASCLSNKHEISVFWDEEDILSKAERKLGIPLKNVKITKNIFSKNVSFYERWLTSGGYDTIFFLSDGSIPFIHSKKTIVHFQFPVEWVEDSLFLKLKTKKINKFICNSDYTKQYIDKKFNIKSKTIYPPVDLIKGLTDERENIILTVGRYSRLSESDFKKLEIMAGIFTKSYKSNFNGWEFVIATSILPEDKDAIEDFIKRVGPNVRVLINLPPDELHNLYRTSKIYWHAAGFGERIDFYPEKVEHFGITTVEAMSAGCVPVVFKAGGQVEIIDSEKNGFFWNTEEELISITEKLIKNEKYRSKIGDQSIYKSKIFSVRRFCEEINIMINE